MIDACFPEILDADAFYLVLTPFWRHDSKIAAKDEWDFEYLGDSNHPFIKANYPHHEGIWYIHAFYLYSNCLANLSF